MIEAMSAGTPVIAWRRGSAPEVIEDGVSGVIVDSVEAAAAAVPIVSQMSRSEVRAEFERRFTAERMARDYVGAYRMLLARRAALLHPAAAWAPRAAPAFNGERQLAAPSILESLWRERADARGCVSSRCSGSAPCGRRESLWRFSSLITMILDCIDPES